MKEVIKRLINEKNELGDKLRKLTKFINEKSNDHSDISKDAWDLLVDQLDVMGKYFEIVGKRLSLMWVEYPQAYGAAVELIDYELKQEEPREMTAEEARALREVYEESNQDMREMTPEEIEALKEAEHDANY